MKNRKLIGFFIFFFLFSINIIAWISVYSLNQPRDFEVVFFDVGQGDSALIKTHLGHYILIDGGETSLVLEKLAEEIPFWRKEIDLIILTHAHADHLGGLIDVIDNYRVENILWNGVRAETAIFNKWEEKLEAGDYNIKIAQLGQRIKSDNFVLDILYPFENIETKTFNDLNLSSIVARASYGDSSFLFMGDAYKSTEKDLIKMEDFCEIKTEEKKCRGMVLESDVLKVGHHGSKTSTSDDFLRRVKPSIAVISSGEGNRYGHPHFETLEVLEKYDIRIARTDKDGDIKIIID